MRLTMQRSYINEIVGIFLLATLLPSAFGKLASQPCCPESNIYTNSCQHNSIQRPIMLKCHHEKFMLDPVANVNDNFTIDKYGNLIVLSSDDTEIPRDKYCTTNFLPPNFNETRRIALVCFENYEHVLTLFLVKGILAFVSVTFILMTLYVYWIIPDLRETQDKVTCFALICLMTFLLFLGIVQIVLPNNLLNFCVPLAYIIYFFTIAYFAWLNLIMLNVWKTSVLPKWRIKERNWYMLNHVYGWLVPISFVISVYLSEISEDGYEPGFGVKSCWFAEKLEAWTFLYFPIATMLGINMFLFLWSIWGLHKHGNDISPDTKKAIAYKCKLYVTLFILAGLNWTMEILSFFFASHFDFSWGWIATDVFNALHGVLIFFVLIVWRRRVRRELAGRRILCFIGPERWGNIKYPEEEQLRDDEENTKNEFIFKN